MSIAHMSCMTALNVNFKPHVWHYDAKTKYKYLKNNMHTLYNIHACTLSIIAYIAEPSVSSSCTSFVTKPCKNPSTSAPHSRTRERCSSFWYDISAVLLWLCRTIELKYRQDLSKVDWVERTQRPWKVAHLQSVNTGSSVFCKNFAHWFTNMLECQ